MPNSSRVTDRELFDRVVSALPERIQANPHCLKRLGSFDPDRAAVAIVVYFWEPLPPDENGNSQMGNQMSVSMGWLLALMADIYRANGGAEATLPHLRTRWQKLLEGLRYSPRVLENMLQTSQFTPLTQTPKNPAGEPGF